MSRYLILVILNIPLIIFGILGAVISFKMHHTSSRRLKVRILLWVLVLIGLVSVYPIYTYLFSNHLTQTEPLSLFDVMQITGIVLILLIANQAYAKVDLLERRVQDLHQELSIRLADNKSKINGKKSA